MKLFGTLIALALFASSSSLALASSCYRAICTGDHVTGESTRGYSLYGTVQSVRADGNVVVEWHFANGWPFTQTAVWPHDLLKKVD